MFGAFRFVLALMVVYQHYVEGRFAGFLAVFSFYCLSGYLMTRVVNEAYSDGVPGYLRFLVNRSLRIFPLYYASLALTLVCVLVWPTLAPSVLGRHPTWPEDAIANLTLLWMPSRFDLLVLPTWSLHVELWHYIAIGALLGRSRTMTVLWLVASIAVPIFMWLIRDLPTGWNFFTVLGSSVAFAAGAAIYHFAGSVRDLTRAPMWFWLIAFPLIGLVLPDQPGRTAWVYIAVPLASLAVIALMHRPATRWDTVLGDLAYPVFLFHMPALVFASWITGSDAVAAPVLGLALTIALSWLALVAIDRPVQQMRAMIRRPARRALAE